MEFLRVIFNFLIDLPKRTTEAISSYKHKLASAQGKNKELENAKNDLTWFFLNNWLLKVIVPLLGITLILVLIVEYFIYILAVGFLWYLIWDHLREKKWSKIIQQQLEEAQKNQTVYRNVTKFMLSSLKELGTWLNIKIPQLTEDITTQPYCDTQNGIDRLYFQLLKKNPESIDAEQLTFARKMLQSLITARLKEKQASENLPLFYDDGEPYLFVDSVMDVGESVYIQLVHVINKDSYNYVKNKKMGKSPNEIKNLPSDEDEDF